MSNPNRTLSHRNLLPLGRQSQSPASSINKDITLWKPSVYESCLLSEQLTKESVTQFLLHNPDFVESFLLSHYSTIRITEILNKMTNESKELIYIPKRSRIFSQKASNFEASKHSPSQISEDHPLTAMSRDSFESILQTSEDVSQWEHVEKVQSPIHTEVLSLNKEKNGREGSPSKLSLDTSNKRYGSDSLPRLSHAYMVSRFDTGPSDEQLNNQHSTLELLQEMKNDLTSILRCDGANVYTIDNVNRVINKTEKERVSTQKIEKGTTLAAFVAHENIPINCQDIFMDDRFPLGILLNNAFIKAAIAQPIILSTGEPIGVIELYRSVEKNPFSTKDEEIFHNYCTWAGLAIYYNEVNIKNQKQEKLNRFILKVTQKMFGKFKNIDSIIKEIMASAKSLVKADRVSLFLVDKDFNELYGRIFDKGTFEECIFETKENVIRFKVGEGIAGTVAATGKTLNIQDAYGDERFNRMIDTITGYNTKNILCMPVKLKKEIIGVVQMLNKKEGTFNKNDEADFETFATYCGLALHISKMYEKILRSQQKYKVALDVLSYHNGYSIEEFEKLKTKSIPMKIVNIDKLSFWPWTVSYDNQPLYVMFMFKDLFGLDEHVIRNDSHRKSFNFDDRFDGETVMRFVLTIKKNYRIVPYHNWNHAFSVAHSMYALLKTCKYDFDLYESLALFIGCLCHDLDHRGKTNEFMVQNSAPLSSLYSTSTMEHHHFNMTITILQRDGHNIFGNLYPQNYKLVLGHIKHCILATDLTKYFEYRQTVESSPEFKSNAEPSNRLLHMALAMTFCDLCSMYKSWDMQLTLVMIIMQEFWNQGDEEKLAGKKPIRLMDRDYMIELPDCQVGFITHVCMPCYKVVSSVMPEASSVLVEVENNLKRWTALANLPEEEKVIKLQELEFYVEKVIEKNNLYVRYNNLS